MYASSTAIETETVLDVGALAGGRVEAELTTLAAHLHAGMCRFLLMVAEFDRRELYESWDDDLMFQFAGALATEDALIVEAALPPRANAGKQPKPKPKPKLGVVPRNHP